VNIRHGYSEFEIFRQVKPRGRRRTHITTFFSRKESGFILPLNFWFLDQKYNKKFCILEHNLVKKGFVGNLSDILFDPDFLTACLVKTRAGYWDSTLKFEGVLKKISILNIVQLMQDGLYPFMSPYSRNTSIFKDKTFLLSRTCDIDRVVLEGVAILLLMVFDSVIKVKGVSFLVFYVAKLNCLFVFWQLKVVIKQESPFIGGIAIVKSIKIKDFVFNDLVLKCLNIKYFKVNNVVSPELFVEKKMFLPAILSKISITLFDRCLSELIMFYYHSEIKFRSVLEGFKYSVLLKSSMIKSVMRVGFESKKLFYFRETDSFSTLMCRIQTDCVELLHLIKKIAHQKFQFVLDLNKTKITHVKHFYKIFDCKPY